MEISLEEESEILARLVRHYLVAHLGTHPRYAFPWEMFQAVSLALRERVMLHWSATVQTINTQQARRLYFLSMEYLPGRMLVNNISNLKAHPLMRRVLEKLGCNYAEILAMEPDPGLGNGGLGRLASCFLDSLATHQYPSTAYGLRYQYGTFEQQIWDGVQVEKPDCWLLNENPWEVRHDGSAHTVKFSGLIQKRINGHGATILDVEEHEEVRALPFDFPIIGYSDQATFNVVTLRLWSTKESPHNFHLQRYNAGQIGPAAENTALTDVLYPNDVHETGKRIRLKQEFLLVSASLQDIFKRHLDYYPDLSSFVDKVRIQINDTHAALVIAELMRLLTQKYAMAWDVAWETTQTVVGFTNHTILAEALEQWDKDRFRCLLPRQYWIIEQINHQLCEAVRKRFPLDEARVQRMSILGEEKIRMAHLAVYGSHKVNGVARLHGRILREHIFRDYEEMFPEKFTYVTNGVSQRHWIWHSNPLLAQFLHSHIGSDWLTDFQKIDTLRTLAEDPLCQEGIQEVKKKNKERLLFYLQHHYCVRDGFGRPHAYDCFLDSQALFDVHAKRVHEYKRQLMLALHAIMLYHDVLDAPESRIGKRLILVSGKAAAGYQTARQIIQLFHCISRKFRKSHAVLQGKLQLLYLENYGVSLAEVLLPAADLSEQISTAGFEASGTGNMKLAINGALTIGTEDGANIEMREAIGETWWPFAFGATAETLRRLRMQDAYNPWDIYAAHPKVKRAVDALKTGEFTETRAEEEALTALFDTLLLGAQGQPPDRYFVLYDLLSYYETQKKVEAYYQNPSLWAKTVLHTMGGMGRFSSDAAIDTYAKTLWHLEKCPVSREILENVAQMYTESILYPMPNIFL